MKEIAIAAAILAIPFLGLLVRARILKEIDQRVQFKFDKEIEIVRSDLRLKEGEISGHQSMVMSRLAGRQAAIDTRRVEALEGIWDTTLKLGTFRMFASLMTILNLEEIDKRPENDESIERLLNPFLESNFKEKLEWMSAEKHRPFIPENV